jgi:hypothetical protein
MILRLDIVESGLISSSRVDRRVGFQLAKL